MLSIWTSPKICRLVKRYQIQCYGYSLESSNWDKCNAYPQNRVWMRFRMPSILIWSFRSKGKIQVGFFKQEGHDGPESLT